MTEEECEKQARTAWVSSSDAQESPAGSLAPLGGAPVRVTGSDNHRARPGRSSPLCLPVSEVKLEIQIFI